MPSLVMHPSLAERLAPTQDEGRYGIDADPSHAQDGIKSNVHGSRRFHAGSLSLSQSGPADFTCYVQSSAPGSKHGEDASSTAHVKNPRSTHEGGISFQGSPICFCPSLQQLLGSMTEFAT